MTFETALEVGDAASSQTVREIETAQQDAAERGGGDFSASKKSGKRPKSLSAKQVKEIVEYEPIDGESIAGWFEGLRRGDLQRITRAVARASVEGLTVSAIASAIRGTKANGYRDGILQTTRDGAAKLARTTINGVCNNARLETIRENEDVVDGAKFVGTLDGRTCPHCGALDGKIWPVKELDAVRRPPIHISCRCCVVPHIDLRTPDGKIVEVGTRPAANADFDALAKESYNKTAREKGLKRRWDDLSPSTRLKYYYQAQKDYERRTGKPAYRQVAPSTTFRDYFKRQPAAFQRAWLGKNRYELYRTGAATFDDLTKPASTYSAKLKDLKPKKESKRTEENFEVLEIVDISGATVRSSKKNVAFKESALFQASKEIRNANDFLDVVDEYRRFTYGNEEAKRLTNEAVAYARRRKQYKRLDCSLIDEINDAVLKSYNRMQATPNDEEAVKEFSRLNEQRKRLVARRDTLKNELAIEAERWRSRRQEIEAFWNLLFPAQNENLFFEQPVIDDWRSIFRAEGKKRGQAKEFEEIAKEVLGLYNKIRGAFANLTTPEVPFLLFADLLDSRGVYLDDIGAIMISDRLTGNQLRATFAHEIGHWLELRCWGYEAATKNTKWLETTLKEDISVKSFKKYVDLDEKEAPTTLWRIDGYSARVYAELEIPGSSTQKYQPSEVISTAFEGLLDDPEAFARAAPEHFNLLLKLLKGETSQ